MIELSKYILLFFIYAFMGWAIEVSATYINNKRFVNRGFLIGPVVPIYAIGGLLITLLLGHYANSIIILFITSVIICSVVEYIISYIMEKLFNLRWWDYSKDKYNINGRICLKNAFLFGLLGVLVIKLFNPMFF